MVHRNKIPYSSEITVFFIRPKDINLCTVSEMLQLKNKLTFLSA